MMGLLAGLEEKEANGLAGRPLIGPVVRDDAGRLSSEGQDLLVDLRLELVPRHIGKLPQTDESVHPPPPVRRFGPHESSGTDYAG
jgi:hypothetical protein